MKWFKWIKVRQSTDEYFYEKMKLFQIFNLDSYLIRYSEGLAIGYRSDVIEGYTHYRLNIQLLGKNTLCLLNELQYKTSLVTLFKADEPHSFGLTKEKGLILSFGLAIKRKKS